MPFFQRETLKTGNGPGNEANAYSPWSLHLEMSKQHTYNKHCCCLVVQFLLYGIIPPIDQRGCGSCLGSPIPIRSPIIIVQWCSYHSVQTPNKVPAIEQPHA